MRTKHVSAIAYVAVNSNGGVFQSCSDGKLNSAAAAAANLRVEVVLRLLQHVVELGQASTGQLAVDRPV